MKSDTESIPKAWLQKIRRGAKQYADNRDAVRLTLCGHFDKQNIQLSKREMYTLLGLKENKSRKAIAVENGISLHSKKGTRVNI